MTPMRGTAARRLSSSRVADLQRCTGTDARAKLLYLSVSLAMWAGRSAGDKGLRRERFLSAGAAQHHRRAGPAAAAALARRGRTRKMTSPSWPTRWCPCRGEASGVAIAREILDRYRALTPDERRALPRVPGRAPCSPIRTVRRVPPRPTSSIPSDGACRALQRAVESPRQEFFRRLNLAPGATAEIVAMRRDLIDAPASRRWRRVDSDLRASAVVVVQPRLPGAAPHRLADAGRHPREDHRLRGRARDPGLGRPAPPPRPGRPALLRLLPSLADRRAADLRRGGADGRHSRQHPVGAGGGAEERRASPTSRRRRCSTRSPTARRACAASRSATS